MQGAQGSGGLEGAGRLFHVTQGQCSAPSLLLADAASSSSMLPHYAPLPHTLQESSDSMADAFEMVELPWLFRKAVAVLNVLEVGGGWVAAGSTF